MMTYEGYLSKMRADLLSPVNYQLVLADDRISLNALIGHEIRIEYLHEIICLGCGGVTKKSYNQGYCYLCFKQLAINDRCVMSPHLCHFAKGTCREPEWGSAHCMQPHIVYLAQTSGLKVGITKPANIPSRWIDQGAIEALSVFQVASRFHSGLIEHYLSQWYNERTAWRKMLSVHERQDIDLQLEANHLKEYLANAPQFPEDVFSGLVELGSEVCKIQYPHPIGETIIKSISLDKEPIVSGKLLGIKGQYLYLTQGVFNVRKHTAYRVRFSADVEIS